MAQPPSVTQRLADVEARLNQRAPQTAEAQAELHAAWREALVAARRELDAQRQRISRLNQDLDSEARKRRDAEAALSQAQAEAASAGASAAGAAQGARQAAATARQLREAAAARDIALERVALLEREVDQLRAEAGSAAGISPEEVRLRADVSERHQEHTEALQAKLADMRSERDRLARDASRLQIELSHAKEKVARLSQQDGRDSAVRDHAVRERDRLAEEMEDERRRNAELRADVARLHAEASAAARRAASAEAAVAAAQDSADRARGTLADMQAARAAEPIRVSQPENPHLRTAVREALAQRDEALALVKQLEEEVRRGRAATAAARAAAEAPDPDSGLWRERAERAEMNIQRYRLLAEDLRAKVLESRRVAFDESARATEGSHAATAAVQKLAAENTQLRKRLAQRPPATAPAPAPAPPPPPATTYVMGDHDAGMSLAVLMGKQQEIDVLRNAVERLRTFAELTEQFCNKAIQRARGVARAQVDAQVLSYNAQVALEDSSTAAVDTLPRGWEQRRTNLGLAFFVSHADRISTWVHPLFDDIASIMDVDMYAPYAQGAASPWQADSGQGSSPAPTQPGFLPAPAAGAGTRRSAGPPKVQRGQWSAYADEEDAIPRVASPAASSVRSNNDPNASRTWDKLAQSMEKRKKKRT